jgi:hypothetical protein
MKSKKKLKTKSQICNSEMRNVNEICAAKNPNRLDCLEGVQQYRDNKKKASAQMTSGPKNRVARSKLGPTRSSKIKRGKSTSAHEITK